MVLRGQGDSPVRICEACMKLEESARFELRHGHKNRAGKGTSKTASRSVDEVLNELMNDGKESARMGSGKEIASQDEDVDLIGDPSNSSNNEMDCSTPEELRQQALDEKNKYKILKGEGKSAEALKAFKRSRELERQAAALELQLRKNRKKALAETQKTQDTSPELGIRDKPVKVKEKDDLTEELKELGWSDLDIHSASKAPPPTSLEGELLNLIQGSGDTSRSKVSSGLDKTQVIAMKKKALALKRDGKLAEAKEELKRAKILEKQLEEQEFLADAEESDDEISALIRSLDNDEKQDFSAGLDLDSVSDFNDISAFAGDFGIDGNFEITEDDMDDPEMAAALQSLGWTEEPDQLEDFVSQPVSVDREALSDEILKLKKEAVSQKRSGNMAKAMSLLKRAKALEKDLESFDSVYRATLDSSAEKESELGGLHSRTSNIIPDTDRKLPKKSRFMIQKELLALKKKALALRREGKLEEADNELKKGKVLEQQLEEMDNPVRMDTQLNVGNEVLEPVSEHLDLSSSLAPKDEESDVTDQDLHDPAYLSLLKTLGWQDEDSVSVMHPAEVSNRKAEVTVENRNTAPAGRTVEKRRRSKAEIQRELLGLKRKALAFRRQGQEAEAEEVLETAKILEEELAEMEAPKVEIQERKAEDEAAIQGNLPENTETRESGTHQTPLKRPAKVNDTSEKRQVVQPAIQGADLSPSVSPDNQKSAAIQGANLSPSVSPDNQKSPVQQEILSHKRKALALKKQGKLAEAKEELRKAKLLERNLEDDKPQNPTGPIPTEVSSREERSSSISALPEERDPPNVAPKPMSSNERLKLQRECLNHKRNALKLRREGRTEEADAELEIAKKLEAQLEEVSPANPTVPSSNGGPVEDAIVEDLFDPQLLSALNAIGLQDAHIVSHTPVKAELQTSSSIRNESSNQERIQLEAQIKAEKVKALNLKRSGKQAEALDALRRAKQIEKKLNLLPS